MCDRCVTYQIQAMDIGKEAQRLRHERDYMRSELEARWYDLYLLALYAVEHGNPDDVEAYLAIEIIKKFEEAA